MLIKHGNFVPTIKIFSIPPYKWYEKAIHIDRDFKKSFNFERKIDTGRKLSLKHCHLNIETCLKLSPLAEVCSPSYLWRPKQGDHKFKAKLGYMGSSRPVWAT